MALGLEHFAAETCRALTACAGQIFLPELILPVLAFLCTSLSCSGVGIGWHLSNPAAISCEEGLGSLHLVQSGGHAATLQRQLWSGLLAVGGRHCKGLDLVHFLLLP